MRRKNWMLICAMPLAFIGCTCEKNDEQKSATAESENATPAGDAGTTPTETGAVTEAPAEGGAVEASVTELKSTDIKEGTGAEAVDGTEVTVHYVGTLTDGKTFDSSRERNQPFVFELGKGHVIKGWEVGVKGMKVGGKRKLVIPPDLGYGEKGAGSVIPPNATLVFEIELIAVK